MCTLLLTIINLHTTFEMFSFTRSKDMMEPKIKKMVTWPRPRPFVIRRIILNMASLLTKFEDSSFSHCRDIKEDPKRKNRGDLGDWGHSRSLAISLFNRNTYDFYSSFIETMCLSRILCEIWQVIVFVKSHKFVLPHFYLPPPFWG